MFDFFEELIKKLGVKLVSNFTDKLCDWIKNIKESDEDSNNDNGRDYTQIGASGDCTQIGASGDCTQIGQIGASGDCTQIGASGDCTQIGASGYGTQIGASGDCTQIGASGDCTQIEISGNNSIGFACGYKTIIKAKRGTWISLAEYRRDDEGNIIPIFAKSAQIGNKEYKDHNGNMLKSNTYYTLYKKEFYAVDIYDGLKTIRLSEKKRDNITIIKAVDMSSILNDKVEEIYIAKEGNLTAHGYTARESVEDLTLKKLGNVNVDEIVAQIKETGKVTRSQYRAITGACSFGTNKFCKEHNIQELEEIEVSELRKILINDYGADKFWRLIDNTN